MAGTILLVEDDANLLLLMEHVLRSEAHEVDLATTVQEAQARLLNAQADAYFSQGESGAATADKYVRLTVLLAAVLFLVGIGSRFPVRVARYGLIGVAGALLLFSLVQLLGLPGPPA